MADLKFEEESYRIRGAIFEVYREMGCGFLETVYQECLEREFAKQGIPFSLNRSWFCNTRETNWRKPTNQTLSATNRLLSKSNGS